jgi:hypothetical protein
VAELAIATALLFGCSSGSTDGSGGSGGGASGGVGAGGGGKGGAAATTGAGGGAGGSPTGSGGAAGRSGGGGAAGTSISSGSGGSAGTGGGGRGGTPGSGGTGGEAGSTTPSGIAGSKGTAGTGGSAGAGGVAGAAGGAAGGRGGIGGGAVSTALVDCDHSDNNSLVANPQPSPSDMIFPMLLQNEGVAFQTVVSTTDSNPLYADLAGYTNVVWYTGAAGQTIFPDQQQILEQWLDTGGKRLVIFSENMAGNLGGGTWTTEANVFLGTYVGAAGSVANAYSYVQETALNDEKYLVTGAAGTPFAAMTFLVAEGTPIASTADVINPASGTTTLATVSVSPGQADGDSPTPIAVGHTKGTSTIVYVGLPIENITAPPMNTRQQFFHAALVYLGIVN